MSKDFIISINKISAIYSKKVNLTIDDDLFNKIQGNLSHMKVSFPLLWSLFEDQYSDSKITPQKLNDLKKEITLFLQDKTVKRDVLKCLIKLKELCTYGIKHNQGLYGIGD